jgi:hypothetical protein
MSEMAQGVMGSSPVAEIFFGNAYTVKIIAVIVLSK